MSLLSQFYGCKSGGGDNEATAPAGPRVAYAIDAGGKIFSPFYNGNNPSTQTGWPGGLTTTSFLLLPGLNSTNFGYRYNDAVEYYAINGVCQEGLGDNVAGTRTAPANLEKVVITNWTTTIGTFVAAAGSKLREMHIGWFGGANFTGAGGGASYDFSNATGLTTVRVGGWQLSLCDVSFNGCSLTSDSVDQLLMAMATTTPAASCVGVTIDLAGTNAAPGPDGTAAKLILQGNGATVNTN